MNFFIFFASVSYSYRLKCVHSIFVVYVFLHLAYMRDSSHEKRIFHLKRFFIILLWITTMFLVFIGLWPQILFSIIPYNGIYSAIRCLLALKADILTCRGYFTKKNCVQNPFQEQGRIKGPRSRLKPHNFSTQKTAQIDQSSLFATKLWMSRLCIRLLCSDDDVTIMSVRMITNVCVKRSDFHLAFMILWLWLLIFVVIIAVIEITYVAIGNSMVFVAAEVVAAALIGAGQQLQ